MSAAGNEQPLHTFVIVGPQGLAYVGLHEDEADAWRIFLGWPTRGEVRCAQAQGWYCERAELRWQRTG